MSEEITKKINPLLERIRLPGETFRLPSMALFYTDGELDASAVDGEVHVYPMTTIDEIVMRTPDRLMDGKAIREVFKRCIPQINDVGRLSSKDVDYLLACLRLTTYGPTMDITYQHDCENAKEHSYSIELRPLLQAAKTIDPTTIGADFKHILPNGQVLMIRPPLFENVMRISQALDFAPADITVEDYAVLALQSLANTIRSVDEITDPQLILEWLQALNAGWIRMISDAVNAVSDWGVSFVHKTKCQDCGKDISISFSTNPLTFFI